MFSKVLIANRGEIAVRIIRSCRELGITTVAIYSDVDRTAPHVLLADEAVHIGPAPSSQSYLDRERILQAAQSVGADALHPGYGFLSENAAFAGAVEAAGLAWIGPAPKTLTQMGDKLAARQLAREAGLPVIPGSAGPLTESDDPATLADEIGYPLLVKAAGGGGGKGLRMVAGPEALDAALERARSESASAFADSRVYLEKALDRPHHVEVQIFGDEHGNMASLGERECSIQRRYQKIIEETPAPSIAPDLRTQLSELALRLAKACDYRGAGTVEFLVDSAGQFYFLEMNTRLQVEHPITELVTGLDLVAEQLRVAAGQPLSFSAADTTPRGHAIECRIYAEDGFNGFAPSTGQVRDITIPGGTGVRLDHGLRVGLEITHHYDPLLGKLCVWGRTRPEAIQRMGRALEELRVEGLQTTIPFCLASMHHPAFIAGDYDTNFVHDHLPELAGWAGEQPEVLETAAAIGAALFAASPRPAGENAGRAPPTEGNWLRQGRDRQVSD